MPRITIGLAVFNGGDLVGPTIEALLAQPFGDFEWLLCDNASTDGTAEGRAAVAEAEPRARFVPSGRNRGGSWNVDRALGLGGGEYFKWVAPDDRCEPRLLEGCVAHLDADAGSVACHTRCDEFDPEWTVPRRPLLTGGRTSLRALLEGHGAAVHAVAAHGAAAHGGTLINVSGIGTDLVDFAVDRLLRLPCDVAGEGMGPQAECPRGGRFIVPVPKPGLA